MSALESLKSGDEYLSVLTVLTGADQDKNDGEFMVRLQESVQKSVILTDAGAFRYETGAEKLVFVPGLKTLRGIVYIYDGTQVTETAMGFASGQNLADVSGEVDLPQTVEKVESNALYFGDESVVLHVADGKDLASLFDADATDAQIEEGGVLYTIEGNGLYCDGEKVGELGISNPIADFRLFKDGKEVGAQLYVEYDKGGALFTAGGFVGADAQRPVSEQTVEWTVNDEKAASIDANGNLTFDGSSNANSVTVTATAKYGGASRSVTVNIVRVLNFTLTLNGAACEEGSRVNVELGTETAYRFEAGAFSYNFAGLQEVSCDTALCFESGDAQVLTIGENGELTPVGVGETTVRVYLAKYPSVSKTFTVEVTDPSAKYFVSKFENFEKYMYRVGNQNAIALSDLFTVEDAPACDGWSVTIYDAATTDADGNRNPMKASGSEFTLSIVNDAGLESKKLSELVYQFSGEGVAIIEIGIVKDGKVYGTTRLAVEVVTAENITAANTDSLGSLDGVGDVLLSDIKLNNGVTYENATLYGNGFTIDASGYKSTNGSDVINLKNSDVDNLVFKGMVFPKVVFNGNNYYNNGLNISGGDCTISNSYISGCRSAIRVEGADNVTLENTVLDGGTYANMQVQSATNLYLKDVTTVQTSKQSVEGNEVMGLGFVFEQEDMSSLHITIEGDLRQYNWVSQKNADILVQYEGSWSDLGLDVGKFVEALFEDDEYASIRQEIDGEEYINTGFLFMGEKAADFADNRTNKDEVVYKTQTATLSGILGIGAMSGTVYTYSVGSSISGDDIKTAGRFTYDTKYTPTAQRATQAKLIVSEDIPVRSEKPKDAEQYFYYDGKMLHIGLSEEQSFTFNAAESAQIWKYGVALTTNVEGQPATPVTFTTQDKGVYTYTYRASDAQVYDVYGNLLTGAAKVVSFDLQVSVELAKQPNAKITPDTSNNAVYGKVFALDWQLADFYLCVPVLEGLSITDYDAEGNVINVLKDDPLNKPEKLTITAVGKQNVKRQPENI